MVRVFWGAVLVLLVAATVASAEMEAMLPDPADVMNSLAAEQRVSDASMVDCAKVADSEFQLLGDAVMQKMVGDLELHGQMDAVMGGEGSASLMRVHTAMGRNWLGCASDAATGYSMMPMMRMMMGSYYPAYYNGYDALLLAAALGWILFFGLLYYHIRKPPKRRR
ncbi:MAG: hypothetical protein HY519_03585 [Candidatus Aenigmarchaeota archaeon]|nr:hypothetical protein [Candidatus Aenigmarchaeota archaeon]